MFNQWIQSSWASIVASGWMHCWSHEQGFVGLGGQSWCLNFSHGPSEQHVKWLGREWVRVGNIHVQKVWCAPKPWFVVITHFSRHATLTQLDFILVATRSWFPRELVGRPPWRYESQLSEHLPPSLKPKGRALRKKKITNISPESRKAVSTRSLFPKPGVFELQLLRESFLVFCVSCLAGRHGFTAIYRGAMLLLKETRCEKSMFVGVLAGRILFGWCCVCVDKPVCINASDKCCVAL